MSGSTFGMLAVMQAMRAGSVPSHVTAADRAVWMVYANFAGPTGFAWPALAEVARVAGCSKDSARRSVAVLRDAGCMRLADPTELDGAARSRFESIPKDRRPTVYQLTPSQVATPLQLATPSQDESPSQDAAHGVASCVERGSNLPPNPKTDPQKDPPKVAPDGAPAPKGSKRIKKAKPERPTHPRYQELYDRWMTTAEKAYGVRPATGGNLAARIGRSINGLLDAYNGDFDKATAAIDRCVQDSRKPDIHAIARNPDGWSPRPKFTPAKGKHVQPMAKPSDFAPPAEPEGFDQNTGDIFGGIYKTPVPPAAEVAAWLRRLGLPPESDPDVQNFLKWHRDRDVERDDWAEAWRTWRKGGSTDPRRMVQPVSSLWEPSHTFEDLPFATPEEGGF